MPQQLTRKEKGCDDSCLAAECSQTTCHQGAPHSFELEKCEECGLGFCAPHLHEVHNYKLCGSCLMEATRTTSVVDVLCAGCGMHVGTQRLDKLQPQPYEMRCHECYWALAFKKAKREVKA